MHQVASYLYLWEAITSNTRAHTIIRVGYTVQFHSFSRAPQFVTTLPSHFLWEWYERACAPQSTLPMFLLPLLTFSKMIWRKASDHGSAVTKLIYQTQEVLDGDHAVHFVRSVQLCLDVICGSPGCLLPYYDTTTPTSLSAVHSKFHSLPILAAFFQILYSIPSFWKDNGGNNCSPQAARLSNISVFKQLAVGHSLAISLISTSLWLCVFYLA